MLPEGLTIPLVDGDIGMLDLPKVCLNTCAPVSVCLQLSCCGLDVAALTPLQHCSRWSPSTGQQVQWGVK